MIEIGRKLVVVLFAVSVLFTPGCEQAATVGERKPCWLRQPGTAVKTELFFGLSKPHGGTVSESQWQQFVDEHITPRFREGLTIVDANGQWLGKQGKVIKEKTKIVILLHSDNEDTNASIEYIRDKYKQLFQQEAVLRINSCTRPF